LEVPEERDYYPYWGPTPWRDIAIMVSNNKTEDLMKKYVNSPDYGHKCEFFELFAMSLPLVVIINPVLNGPSAFRFKTVG